MRVYFLGGGPALWRRRSAAAASPRRRRGIAAATFSFLTRWVRLGNKTNGPPLIVSTEL